jgi:hypothetical protein
MGLHATQRSVLMLHLCRVQQQRVQAPQRQPVARQPQSVVTRDDGRAWLESEMNPVGRR